MRELEPETQEPDKLYSRYLQAFAYGSFQQSEEQAAKLVTTCGGSAELLAVAFGIYDALQGPPPRAMHELLALLDAKRKSIAPNQGAKRVLPIEYR